MMHTETIKTKDKKKEQTLHSWSTTQNINQIYNSHVLLTFFSCNFRQSKPSKTLLLYSFQIHQSKHIFRFPFLTISLHLLINVSLSVSRSAQVMPEVVNNKDHNSVPICDGQVVSSCWHRWQQLAKTLPVCIIWSKVRMFF